MFITAGVTMFSGESGFVPFYFLMSMALVCYASSWLSAVLLSAPSFFLGIH